MSIYDGLEFKRRKGTAGIGGQIYEIELCTLLLLQGIENKKISDFCLASNTEEAADFDDAVFKFHYEDDSKREQVRCLFLQAKHKEKEEKTTGKKKEETRISLESLLSQAHNGDFVLRKYLSSYLRIEALSQSNHPIFNHDLENCEFVIYTNAQFNDARKCDEEHIGRKIIEPEHVLNLGDTNEGKYYYQLNKTEKVLKALRPSLNYEILVKELIQTIREKSLDMNKPIFNCYHAELKNNVIKITSPSTREGKFVMENEIITSIFEEITKKPNKNVVEKFDANALATINNFKTHLRNLTIKLPEKFLNSNEDDIQIPLPTKLLLDKEIKQFLTKLKLFFSQPNERQLGTILQDKIKLIYNLEPFDDSVFSDVTLKILQWWREEKKYLTKSNKYFQDSAKVCIWFDVRPPTELFTGREKELDELHKKITRVNETVTVISQMTIISGLGGIGKTELARRYINQYTNDYQNNIIWMNADNKQTLSEGFVRLAKDRLNIRTKSEGKKKSIDTIIGDVYNFFSTRKSLFVFDNATNSNDFAKFLPLKSLKPSDQKPYILITSRDQEWDTGIEVLGLFVLRTDDAVNLVKKGLKIQQQNEDEQIEKLVTTLQCFPLALRQAIAYIDNKHLTSYYSFSDYLKDFDKKTKELLKSTKFQSISCDYVKTTFTTWKMTIQKIKKKQNGRLALEILSIMAYIASDNINRDIFTRSSTIQDKIVSAVSLLVKYSMIDGELRQTVLRIHKLVQEVTRIELNDTNNQSKFIQKTFHLFYYQPHVSLEDKLSRNVADKKQFLPHLEAFLIHVENWLPPEQNEPRFFLLHVKTWMAKRKWKQLKQIRHAYLVALFNWLACGYTNYDPKRKVVIMENNLKYARNIHPMDVTYLAKVIVDLAFSYRSLSDHMKQKKLLEECIDILEKFYNTDSEELIFPLIHLSDVYGYLGNADERLELLMRALTINQTCNKNHNRRNIILKALADTYESFGEIQRGKQILEMALKCGEGVGVNDIKTIDVLIKLVRVYEKLGESEKKKELLERIENIYENYCSSGEEITPEHLKNLAYIYGQLGKYQTQLKILELLLKSEEDEDFYDYHIVDTLQCIGNAHKHLDDYQETIKIFERILKIQEKAFGEDNFNLAPTLETLADAYGYLGERTIQIQLLERSLQLNEEYYGPDNYNLVLPLMRLEFVSEVLGDQEKRKQILERVLKIKEDCIGLENYQLIDTLTLLSDVFRHLGDNREQRLLLERALLIADKHYHESFCDYNQEIGVLEWDNDAYKCLGDENDRRKVTSKMSVTKKYLTDDDFVIETTVTYGNADTVTTQV